MTIFPYRPSSLVAKISWLTGVAKTYSSERRTELRSTPRLNLSAGFSFAGDKAIDARQLIARSAGEIAVPDWRYAQIIAPGFSATSLTVEVDLSYFFMEEGASVLVWVDDSTYTATTIASINGSYITLAEGPATAYSGAVLMRLYDAVVNGELLLEVRRSDYVEASLDVTVVNYEDLQSRFSAGEFSGDYIAARNVILNSHSFTTASGYSNVDFEVGVISPVQVKATGEYTDTLQFNPGSGKELMETEAIFHKLKGRLNSFWKPTWLSDFSLHSPASAGNLFLRVHPVPEGADIPAVSIELVDGSVYYYAVSSWESFTDYTQLSLVDPIANGFDAVDVVTISLVRRARLDTDDAVFRFDGVGSASVRATTYEVPL